MTTDVCILLLNTVKEKPKLKVDVGTQGLAYNVKVSMELANSLHLGCIKVYLMCIESECVRVWGG
jgi:hypothetical protein